MTIKIALAGNPNSGKTTLFNALTGSNQYVGNWPGVTVEKKTGRLRGFDGVEVVDLPGIYSLSPYTLEEITARDFLVEQRPDVILNIVDGTNLERNLYLTSQLAELGFPLVVAVNMMDAVKKSGGSIDTALLEKRLGFPLVEISALKGTGIREAAEAAVNAAKTGALPPAPTFAEPVEQALALIENVALENVPPERQRWYAVKVFERDSRVMESLAMDAEAQEAVENAVLEVERLMDDDAESVITDQRYVRVAAILEGCYKRKGGLSPSDKIDSVVTSRWLALPIFAAVMWAVYTISMGAIGSWTVELVGETVFGQWIIPAVTSWMEAVGCAPWLTSLVTEGVIGSVGAVLSFVPQLLVLFLLLAVLEDVGYMARVAFIMDRVCRRFGLSGKSFIPMLISSGCGVPGIMASRTIEQERDRRMTVMTTCFIPCGAKLPMISMIAGALFGGSGWIAASAYFAGVAAVAVSGIILKKTKPFAGRPAPFVMELPDYHAPSPANVLRATWDRGWGFVRRAGTLIAVAGVVIWALNSLTLQGGLRYIGEGGETSILNAVGRAIAVIFRPLGFGGWQAAVATVLGLAAKEQVVGVFGSLSSMSGGVGLASYGAEFFDGSALAAYSFMLFNLLCAPCFAAMGAIKREMKSTKWTLGAIGYMCGFAYAVSLMVYQLGSLLNGGRFGVGTAVALVVLAVTVWLLVRKNKYADAPPQPCSAGSGDVCGLCMGCSCCSKKRRQQITKSRPS